MAKILLIVPTHGYKSQYPSFLSVSDFPMGYTYISAALKQAGHEVIGLNLNNDPNYHSAYEMILIRIEKALASPPDLIGIGGIVTDYHFIKDALSIIRRANSAIPIVLGGGIVTNDAEYIFNLLKPDYAIVGEAEKAIVQLANKEDDIRNLWYWNKGVPTFTGKDYNYQSIDSLPFPDYETFGIGEMLDKYSMATRVLYRYSRPYPRVFNLVASRSCPFSCHFCVHGHDRPKYRARSIDNIMEEIKTMYERYHFNVLILLDELFAVNKKRMIEFMFGIAAGKELYGWDFDWMFQTHAAAKLDAETLALAKQYGCFFFSYGIESASSAVLKSMNKKTKVSQIVEAIKLAKEAKIGFGGNLIYGDPAETHDTLFESFDFYLRYCKGAMVFHAFLMPYPGSKIFADCIEKGIIPNKLKYYENIDQIRYNMTGMPMEEWMKWMFFIEKMSAYWWGVENTEATKIEKDDTPDAFADYYKFPISRITANCPYCGEEILYRNALVEGNNFIGVGCTKCQQKIRINV